MINEPNSDILNGNKAYDKYLELKNDGLILFECIVGSQAYGTSLPTSDIDKKFIYIDTFDAILSGNKINQINITDDYVGYELGRYFELLLKQSPNMHELVWLPEDCIEYCHPLFKELIIGNRSKFISRQIKFSFGEYAKSQISKARGLNKKIVNPIDKERKTPLDFCWVPYKQGSINVVEWLKEFGLFQEYCGLVGIDHMKYTYQLFYDFPAHVQNINYTQMCDMNKETDFLSLLNQFYCRWPDQVHMKKFYDSIKDDKNLGYKGIIQKSTSNAISLSSVPKNLLPLHTMYFNLEGYTKYCKDYKDYWNWVDKRNEVRYQTNLSHGAQYDSKNMAHCHRLLDTCIEALRDKVINVRRPNREQLLKIRNGDYIYDDLLKEAEDKIDLINDLYNSTLLPNGIDTDLIKDIVIKFRKIFYGIN